MPPGRTIQGRMSLTRLVTTCITNMKKFPSSWIRWSALRFLFFLHLKSEASSSIAWCLRIGISMSFTRGWLFGIELNADLRSIVIMFDQHCHRISVQLAFAGSFKRSKQLNTAQIVSRGSNLCRLTVVLLNIIFSAIWCWYPGRWNTQTLRSCNFFTAKNGKDLSFSAF